MILSPSDFVGKYELHTGIYVQSKLQNYIDIYEPMYLKHLFGIDLYNQFAGDLLNNVPQSPNFLAVFNPLSEDLGYSFYWGNSFNNVNTMIISQGIKEMLKGFIYFEYAKDLNNQMTPYGNVKPISENSEVVSTLFSMMYTRYNEAINSYRAIQRYIRYTNNPPLGQIVTISIINGGLNYSNLTGLTCINGSGTGAVVDIEIDAFGTIEEIIFTNKGINFKVGDVVTVKDGLNVSCTFLVEYIGTGDYSKFRGVSKSTAYWL